MTDSRRDTIIRILMIVLLAVYFCYELHMAFASAGQTVEAPYTAQSVLRAAGFDQLSPVRIPEKITIRAEISESWEHVSRRESGELAILLLFLLLCALLMLFRYAASGRIPDSTNLPHKRVLEFIHRADGKGPENLILS